MKMARSTRSVYLVDDNIEFRRSLHFLLATEDIMVWSFASAEDFLANIEELAPAPILLDVRMGGMDGLELLNALDSRDIRWPVIMVSAHGDIETAVEAVRRGAIDFLEKPFRADLLDRKLEFAFACLRERLLEIDDQSAARALFDRLTHREMDVLQELMPGRSNKAAAHALGLSVRTVEMHRANALTKLHIRTIAEALAIATRAGLGQKASQEEHGRKG
jgi:two-component system response regulator FixJ